jgi:hypothetical protein
VEDGCWQLLVKKTRRMDRRGTIVAIQRGDFDTTFSLSYRNLKALNHRFKSWFGGWFGIVQLLRIFFKGGAVK